MKGISYRDVVLFYFLLNFVSSVVALSYEELLSKLSTDTLDTAHSEGDFSFSLRNDVRLSKRVGLEAQKLHDILSRLPELNIHSFDNAEALEIISKAANDAYTASNYGDFFYLWQVMLHNGYPGQINNLSNGQFQREGSEKIPSFESFAKILADTSTIPGVADMYFELKKKSHTLLPRGDVTICACSNIPNIGDCESLYSALGKGVVYPRQRAWCHGKCCAAWNEGITFYSFWAQRKAGWCMTHCIRNGFSCKIENIWFFEKRVNFCTSSVAICT